MATNSPLNTLLAIWHQQLSAWAGDGSLDRAAREAFNLQSTPEHLESLFLSWSLGDFSLLPSIEAVGDDQLRGSAGAYSSTTSSIYLDANWLQTSSPDQILAVLTEELGHHLDAQIHDVDTPGDEGELFSRRLTGELISNEQLDRLRSEQDQSTIIINNQVLNVENNNANNPEPASSQNQQITNIPLNGQLSIDGLKRHTLQLNLKDTTYTTSAGTAGLYSAFDGDSASIVIELAADVAPITANNILQYVNSKFYENTIFHRVIDGFMVQGGGYDGTTFGAKTTAAPIPLESTLSTGLRNTRGTVAMARTADPNSASSQFFINTVNNDFLNYSSSTNPGYAVFGTVITGMEIVDAISKAPKRKQLIATQGVFSDITEPVVTITSVNLLERPAGISYSLASPSSKGDVQIKSDGTYIYTPGATPGDDFFTYNVTVPARLGLPEHTIQRQVNLWSDDGTGFLSDIQSSRSGFFEEGVTLEAGRIEGDPDGAATISRYQWYLNNQAIPGATLRTYAVGAQGHGNYTVAVTYSDAQNFSATLISPVQSITKVDNGNGRLSAISSSNPGVYEEGVTLSAGSVVDDPDGAGQIRSYQWYRNGMEIQGANGSSLQIGVNSIDPSQATDTYQVEVIYTDSQAFGSGPIRSSPIEVTPLRTATAAAEQFVGRALSQDDYIFRSLESSTMRTMDRITNYEPSDRIDSPMVQPQTLKRSLGTLKVDSFEAIAKSQKAIGTILSKRRFKANQAAAFAVKQGRSQLGTAIAINDAKAGFQADSDAIIFLDNFKIGAITPVTMI